MTDDGRAISARTASAASWLVGGRMIARVIDMLGFLLLARLLLPADFGIVAIAMTLIMIVEAVLELPVGQVLLRLPRLERHHLDTAFTLGALRGLVLAAGMMLLALPFSRLYGDARLVPLIGLLGLAPALRGLLSPQLAVYIQRIDYRRSALIDVAGKLVALMAAIAIALTTRSYWAIAAGTVVNPATMLVVSYAVAPYRPRLTLSSWRLFAGFFGWMTAAQAFGAIGWQCDRLLLGRFVPQATLGGFSLANDIAYLPEQSIIKPIVAPLTAAFALLRLDAIRLRLAYSRAAVAVLAVGAPMMIGLGLLAEPAVRFALGARWLVMVPILRWLALSLVLPLFAAPLPSLAMATGRPRLLLWINVADVAIRVPVIAAGAIWFGVWGVVVARAAAAAAMALVSMLFVRALIGTRVLRQIGGTWRVAAAGVMLALVLVALRPMLHGATGVMLGAGIAACGGGALAVYVATLMLIWRLSGRPAGLERAVADYLLERRGLLDALARGLLGRGAGRLARHADAAPQQLGDSL